jgi:hypothetical protein
MPIDISWQQDKRVIYERFYGTITIEEMTAIQQEFLRYLNEGDAPVHAVIDLGGVRDFPKSLSDIRRGLVSTGTTQLGRVVLVTGKNQLVRFISSVISQLILKNAQYALCDSLDEALRILRDGDATVTIERIES